MNGKDHSDEISDGNEEHATGNWRKGHACDKVAKSLAELCSCSSVLWKVELASDEIGCLAEELSKQSVETWPGFSLLLTVKRESRELD